MRCVGVNYRILEFYHTQFIRGYCIGLLLLLFKLLYILFQLLLNFSVLSFCLFILFMGFSRPEYWRDLTFLSPVDHILSELSTMTLSVLALHSMAHSFVELDRLCSMWSVWLVFCDSGFHSICPLMNKDKRLTEASWWERLWRNWILFW